MSTHIPLTLIEGVMALPRLQPLGELPAPFGRDWSLLPPARAVRAELKALYAAVMRTFCVSAQTLRSLCKWEPLARRALEQAESAMPPGHADSPGVAGVAGRLEALLEETALVSAPLVVAAPVQEPIAHTSPSGEAATTASGAARRGSMKWPMLAGSACALGGVAILAWISTGHVENRQNPRATKPPRPLSSAAHRSAVPRAATLASKEQAASAAKSPEARDKSREHALADVASFARIKPAARVGEPSSVQSSSTLRNATRHVSRSRSGVSAPTRVGARTPQRLTERQSEVRRSDAWRADRERSVSEPRYTTSSLPIARYAANTPAINERMPRFADLPATASRASAGPSAAHAYSPLAPSSLGNDEYASVRMSAGTHLRDIATSPARALTPYAPQSTSGTEWMSRMSQRRVTDIPDQFSR